MLNDGAQKVLIPEFPVLKPEFIIHKDERVEQLQRYVGTPLHKLIQTFDGYCQIPSLAEAIISVRERMLEEHKIGPLDFVGKAYNEEFERNVATELFVSKEEARYNVIDTLGAIVPGSERFAECMH